MMIFLLMLVVSTILLALVLFFVDRISKAKAIETRKKLEGMVKIGSGRKSGFYKNVYP